MFDPDNSYREQRRNYRDARRYNRYRNPMRGLGAGLFLIALIIAFAVNKSLPSIGFLPILFIGLAFLSLFGAASSGNRNAIYGGFNGFIWMLGLALCFWIGFWPWILLPVAATMIAGALFNPFTMSRFQGNFQNQSQQQGQFQQTPPQQEMPNYQSQETPGYQPYQQGYQPPSYPGAQHQTPKQEYEQPMVQYPEQQQELPPIQQ